MSAHKILHEVYRESRGRHVQFKLSSGDSLNYLIGDVHIFKYPSEQALPLTQRALWRGIILYYVDEKRFTVITEQDSMYTTPVFEYSFHDHLEVLLVMKT